MRRLFIVGALIASSLGLSVGSASASPRPTSTCVFEGQIGKSITRCYDANGNVISETDVYNGTVYEKVLNANGTFTIYLNGVCIHRCP